MKRIITLLLAVATLTTIAQEHSGKHEKDQDKRELRSNEGFLKRDIAEIETMRAAKAEFETAMNVMDVEQMKSAKNAMLKLMDKELEQARTRSGMDRAEMMRSVKEAEQAKREASKKKPMKKPGATADDVADAKDDKRDLQDDRSDLDLQVELMAQMNSIFMEIQKIEITSKPQRLGEGRVVTKADEFIALMQQEIFKTRDEIEEDKGELHEDREESREDRKRKSKKRK
jgi:hypothetical protein